VVKTIVAIMFSSVPKPAASKGRSGGEEQMECKQNMKK
jgi:hypothetical protein